MNFPSEQKPAASNRSSNNQQQQPGSDLSNSRVHQQNDESEESEEEGSSDDEASAGSRSIHSSDSEGDGALMRVGIEERLKSFKTEIIKAITEMSNQISGEVFDKKIKATAHEMLIVQEVQFPKVYEEIKNIEKKMLGEQNHFQEALEENTRQTKEGF